MLDRINKIVPAAAVIIVATLMFPVMLLIVAAERDSPGEFWRGYKALLADMWSEAFR